MNGDMMTNRNIGFSPVGNMAATPWNNNNNNAIQMTPPNFSVPPPNLCGGFPRFSGPMYNQPTFQRGRMPSPRMNVPPPSFRGGRLPQCGPPPRQVGFVNDDIFGDAPADIPCGFPYFNPRHPPPMPLQTNIPSHAQGGRMRGGGRGFHGNHANRGQGPFQGTRPGQGMMKRGGGQSQRGDRLNNGHDGFQKKKKPRIDKRELPENNVFFCDICDRGFKNEEKYQEHVDSHQKCSYKDCPFMAAPKLVQLHMSMQHRGGMAKKIWSIQSEEDIKKWREERKKNFPTAENVQKKKERLEERISRGEVIETKDFSKMTTGKQHGRGNRRGRGRFQRGRGRYNDDNQADDAKTITIDDGDDDDSPVEVKIKRSQKSGKNKEKETKCVVDLTKQNEEKSCAVVDLTGLDEDKSDAEDEDGQQRTCTVENDDTDAVTSPNKKVDKLGLSLLSGYGSSASEECDDDDDKGSKDIGDKETDDKQSDKKESRISLPEWPDDEEITKTEGDCRQGDDGAEILETIPKTQNGIVDIITKTSSCNQEKNVTDGSHVLPEEKEELEANNKVNSDKKAVKRSHAGKDGPVDKKSRYTPKLPQKSYTLLEKLLSKEIRRERNKILQCVHFIVKNKFFDNTSSSSTE